MPLEDIEEEEPLTGGGADEKLAWRPQKKNTIVERLDSISPHWQWFAHLILLSLSMTFFALSFCIKSAKHPIPTDGRLPETYCMSDTKLAIFHDANTENLAPALGAIKYEIQHFDLPPVPEGPFVGKGDDVDAMWDYITDGSRFSSQ